MSSDEYYFFICIISAAHVSHLENADDEELNRLNRIVVDVDNLLVCVTREEDQEAKQVYFYLFKVTSLIIN